MAGSAFSILLTRSNGLVLCGCTGYAYSTRLNSTKINNNSNSIVNTGKQQACFHVINANLFTVCSAFCSSKSAPYVLIMCYVCFKRRPLTSTHSQDAKTSIGV